MPLAFNMASMMVQAIYPVTQKSFKISIESREEICIEVIYICMYIQRLHPGEEHQFMEHQQTRLYILYLLGID